MYSKFSTDDIYSTLKILVYEYANTFFFRILSTSHKMTPPSQLNPFLEYVHCKHQNFHIILVKAECQSCIN